MDVKYIITYAIIFGITFSMMELEPIMATLFDEEKFKSQLNPPIFYANNSNSINSDKNSLTDNHNLSSDIPSNNAPNQPQECEMPPCPPGQACIQMCP